MNTGGRVRGERVISFDELAQRLIPRAEILDGEPGFDDGDWEINALWAVIMHSDVGAPGFYNENEVAHAEEDLQYYMDLVDDRHIFAMSDPCLAALSDQEALEAVVSGGARMVRDEHQPLIDHLAQLADPDGTGVTNVTLPDEQSAPYLTLHFDGLQTASGCGTHINFNMKADSTFSELAEMLYFSLPNDQRKLTNGKNKCQYMIDFADGHVYVSVYRILPGNRLLYVGAIEIPDEHIRDKFYKELFPSPSVASCSAE